MTGGGVLDVVHRTLVANETERAELGLEANKRIGGEGGGGGRGLLAFVGRPVTCCRFAPTLLSPPPLVLTSKA